MKKFKKVFAVILSLAMVLGMSMTAFATEQTTNSFNITVQGLQNGAAVSYKQIVKATSEGKWELGDGLGTVEGKVDIGMTAEEIQNKYERGDSYASTGTINANLKTLNLSGIQISDLTPAGTATTGDLVFTVNSPGLYAIKVATTNNYVYSWMLAYVGFDADGNKINATVKAKGQTNQVTKAVGDNRISAGSGDTIPYTVTVKYPYFADDVTNRSFTITDEVTGGKFVGNPEITILGDNNVPVTGNHGLTKDTENSTDTKLIISLAGNSYNDAMAGKTIQVTYNVKANKNLSNLSNNVSTEIKHKTDGNLDPETEHKTVYKVILPSFNATITKTDEKGNKITGSEVEFELYREKKDTDSSNPSDPSYVETVKVKVNGEEVEKDLVLVQKEKSAKGEITFRGLAAESDVKYYVKETKAPNGFQIQKDAYPLTGAKAELKSTETENVKEGNLTVTTKTDTYGATYQYNSVGFNDDLNFHDTNLSALPSTGGIGTTIFTIGGCAIMIIAAALFFASRRRAAK